MKSSNTTFDKNSRDYVNTIHDSTNLLLDIINDILDFSKIESAKVDLELVDFDVCAAVDATVQLIAAQAREKGLALLAYVSPAIPRLLRGDEGHIRQILLNLLANAVKFTESGEVTVSVEPEEVAGQLFTLRFSITDSGIGFPEGSLERLFQPFTQADGSITRRFGGTGLGLSICKGLVELMGGKIGAQRGRKMGSTFWFTTTLSAESLCEERPQCEELRGKRLLISGMPASIAQILQAYAKAWGADCEYVPTLREAHKTDPNEYDALLMQLAEHAGLEDLLASDCHDQIRAKCIFLAKDMISDLPQEACGLPILAYPITRDQLGSVLRSVVVQLPCNKLNAVVTQPIPELKQSKSLILIAEDSPTNRKVAMLQLASLGFVAQAVANGREAVEAMETGVYALVLMDCQMPEMDGFQAAAAIRKLELRTGRHTPIIAMTAHALKGDREQCISAGMDDYISKPVDIEQLQQLLLRWLGVTEAVYANSPSTGIDGVNHLDASQLTTLEEPIDLPFLQKSCGDEVICEILQVYLSAAETLLDGLDEGRVRRDARAVESLAHQLAGSSRAVCAIEMARLADIMEEAGIKQNWTHSRSVSESLRWALKRLRRFLASAIADGGKLFSQ